MQLCVWDRAFAVYEGPQGADAGKFSRVKQLNKSPALLVCLLKLHRRTIYRRQLSARQRIFAVPHREESKPIDGGGGSLLAGSCLPAPSGFN